MHKLIVITCLLFASVPGFAKSSAKATLASDFNWRGLSFLAPATPMVSGEIDYNTDFNLGGGVWMANNGLGGYEANQYIYYWMKMSDVTLTGMANHFSFPRFSKANTLELSVAAAIAAFKATLYYIPEYFGAKTSDIHVELTYELGLDENLFLVPTVGYSSFSDAKTTSYLGANSSDNYADWKIAAQYRKDGFVAELAMTNTNRSTIDAAGVTTKVKGDEKTIFTLSKAF